MAEDWQLKQLERRFDSLEERLERDRERAREEEEQTRKDKRQRAERINCRLYGLAWTACVATIVTYALWG
jgi:hypothetical protein